jgi:hypothetical protein
MDWQWNEFVQWHQVVGRDQGHVEDVDKSVVLCLVDIQHLNQKDIRWFMHERDHFLFVHNFIYMLYDLKENLVMKSSGCRSVGISCMDETL